MGTPVEELELRIAAIGGDRDHGSTFLAMEAVRILAAAAEVYGPGPDWQARLSEVAGRLAAAKPAMAVLRNATHGLLEDLAALGPVEGRPRADALAQRLLAAMRTAAETAAANAARLIAHSATVATCSYSSAVLRTAQRALADGKSPRMVVLEPAPRPPSAGHGLAKELENLGLAVEMSDSAGSVAERATVAITGADAVSPEWAVNGAPTMELAEAASAAQVPFYVVCERLKLTDRAIPAPGYDLVPMALVAGVATEEGLLPPGRIYPYHTGVADR